MTTDTKIYEGVEGLIIDIYLYDKTNTPIDSSGILSCSFCVLPPGSTEEELWSAEVIPPNIIRHTIPENANIVPGRYKIQPYITTTDGFSGLFGTVIMPIFKKWK